MLSHALRCVQRRPKFGFRVQSPIKSQLCSWNSYSHPTRTRFGKSPGIHLPEQIYKSSRRQNSISRHSNSMNVPRSFSLSVSKREDPVVSTEWLARRMESPDGKRVVLADVRGRVDQVPGSEEGLEESIYIDLYDEYLEGHIPGAVFISWLETATSQDPDTGVPAQLFTDTTEFAMEMESKGIGTDDTVVVYDSGDGLLAPRFWWALRRHGHPDVRVLQGGFNRWTQEGRPISQHEPCPLKVYADYDASHPRGELQVSLDDIKLALQQPQDNVLIDARNSKQFDNLVRRANRGGRIPGSINVPRGKLVGEEGWPSVEEIKSVFETSGVDLSGGKKIITYCNGGVASCTVLLALDRLGISDAANYDASWNEWGNRDDVSIEVP